MNAHANKGFASRIGFGLGTFVRFLITDPKPLRRWVKRTLVSGTLLVLASQAFSWLLSGALTLIVLGGAVLAFGGLPNGPRKKTRLATDMSMARKGMVIMLPASELMIK
ncbi:hypothetical protein P4110_30050 [Pseudomonas aeruginosa]|nr:hypothetical protein [Pseudomonas aeruginosa]